VDALADQIDKALSRATHVTPEAQHINVDGYRPIQVGDIKLRDK
jgi:hypothetical protein